MNPILVGGIIEAVGKVADDLFTSDEERDRMALQAFEAETDRLSLQTEINREEARHDSLFVAGWRPAVGWCGVLAMFYQFIAYPLLGWCWHAMQAAGWVSIGLMPPPAVDTEALWVILTGILGLGAARSAEKIKGVSRQSLEK